jgi:hypothetical protein
VQDIMVVPWFTEVVSYGLSAIRLRSDKRKSVVKLILTSTYTYTAMHWE